jgi:hypothetical protein
MNERPARIDTIVPELCQNWPAKFQKIKGQNFMSSGAIGSGVFTKEVNDKTFSEIARRRACHQHICHNFSSIHSSSGLFQ